MTRSLRIWLVAILVGAALAVASGLATRPSVPPITAQDTPEATQEASSTAQESLAIGASRSQTVRARVGQPLRLTVTGAGQPDTVTIVGLDQTAQISPQLDATFDLLPDRAGTYPIELQTSGEDVGALRVGG